MAFWTGRRRPHTFLEMETEFTQGPTLLAAERYATSRGRILDLVCEVNTTRQRDGTSGRMGQAMGSYGGLIGDFNGDVASTRYNKSDNNSVSILLQTPVRPEPP